jgi:hypothetical protein
MKIANDLGIWMDHSSAHLMEFTVDPIETTTLKSKFTHGEKEESFGKSENVMHNKEQHQQREYYKDLIAVIRNYTAVVLFGPTDAKTELLNLIRQDHNLEKIKIEVKQTDKLTENQQHAFVKDYFSKQVIRP